MPKKSYMNRKIILVIIIVGAALASIYTLTGMRPSDKKYRETILRDRAETNETFKKSADSPLTAAQKASFTSLSYFEISENYKVTGVFIPNPEKQIVKMAITDGSQREYYIFGTANFKLEGKEFKLTVFKPVAMKEEYYFIPFYDATTGELSYGGGRYVEPEMTKNGEIVIDFNKAYNPYCAYNHKYRCPIPPAENSLEVEVRAGEKNPEFVK